MDRIAGPLDLRAARVAIFRRFTVNLVTIVFLVLEKRGFVC